MYIVFTFVDVLREDFDVLVTIRSALLVPSSQSVEDLVYHDTFVLAIHTDGDILSSFNSADIRPTPAKDKHTRA